MIGVIKGTMRQKKEVTGLPLPIASYKANMKVPIRSLKVAITAVQSGSGDPSPDNIRPIIGASGCNVVRCGKNFIDYSALDTYSNWKTDIITVGNAPTSNYDRGFILPTKAGVTYTISFGVTADDFPSYLYLCKTNKVDTSTLVVYISTNTLLNQNYTFTADDSLYYLRLSNIANETNFNSKMAKLSYAQLELGSTATTYEAYTGNTYTIQLGDTYYGGTLNVTTGLLTVTWEGGDIKDFDWQYSQTLNYFSVELADSETGTASDMPNIKTSVFETIPYNERTQHSNVVIDLRNQAKYVEVRNSGYTDVTAFKQAFAGQTLIYKLATPITVQLTPTQIEQLLGANNVWADTGDVEELEYTDRQVYYGR